jgi:hypothetical protein
MAVVLAACLASAAIGASAAQAQWTIGSEGTGPGTALSGIETVTISGTALALHTTLLGETITITASGIQCASGKTCTIDNNTGTNHSAGTLEFTGVTMDDPPNCEVKGGKITTKELTDEVKMASGETNPFDNFKPQSGAVFAELEITGPKCTIAGNTIEVKGEVAGEAAHPTGYLAVDQVLAFTEGGEIVSGSSLHIGKSTRADLTGTVHNKLSGTHKGEAFGADE